MARINCTAIAQFARYRWSTELKASTLSAATDITALGMTRLPGARPSELRAVQRMRPDHTASTLTRLSGAVPESSLCFVQGRLCRLLAE